MKKSIFEKRIVVIILALTATFLWGSAFPAIKLGYQYMHIDGIKNPNDKKAISRHEIMCNLEDVINASSHLVKNGGRVYMVHLASRLSDIIFLMKNYNSWKKMPNKEKSLIKRGTNKI